eukprot:8918910-Pyramimonas_sp.AAC.1
METRIPPENRREKLMVDSVAMMQHIYAELYSWDGSSSPAKVARSGRCDNALYSDLGRMTRDE